MRKTCWFCGSTSLSITMGNMHEIPRRSKDGIVFDRCLPLGIVMDERIATGHYFALAFNRFRQYLAKPEQLEGPPKKAEEKMKEAAAVN